MKKASASGPSRYGRPLRKSAPAEGWLVFLDESGFLLAPLARCSWAPRGQTPALYQRGRHHKKVSAIAALCVSPQRHQVRLYFRFYPGRDIDAPRVLAFLQHLDRELETHCCLLWDQLNAHRAKTTTAWLAAIPSCPHLHCSSSAV